MFHGVDAVAMGRAARGRRRTFFAMQIEQAKCAAANFGFCRVFSKVHSQQAPTSGLLYKQPTAAAPTPMGGGRAPVSKPTAPAPAAALRNAHAMGRHAFHRAA